MKVKMFYFLAIVMLLGGFSDQDKKYNHLEMQKLKGKVKSVREYYLRVDENTGILIGNESLVREVIFFNHFGNMIESYRHNEKGELETKTIYKYNDNELITEKLLTNEKSETIGKETHSYDYKMREIERIHFNTTKTRYKYDANDYLIEEIKYDPVNKILEKHKYVYNKYGIKTEGSLESFNPDGNIKNKTIYLYDAAGNLIEANSYDSAVDFLSKTTQKYDDKSNCLEIAWYRKDGSIDSKESFGYDDFGNQNEIKSYGSNRNMTSHFLTKYEFDKNKNWIKSMVYSNNVLVSLYRREIEYYPD